MSDEPPVVTCIAACLLLAFGAATALIGVRAAFTGHQVVGRRSLSSLRIEGQDARVFGVVAAAVGAVLVVGSCVLLVRTWREGRP